MADIGPYALPPAGRQFHWVRIYALLRVCVDKFIVKNCFSPDKSFFAARKLFSITVDEAFELTVNYILKVIFTGIILSSSLDY
jgi:hypothetical protein